jgi:hypothetical protein
MKLRVLSEQHQPDAVDIMYEWVKNIVSKYANVYGEVTPDSDIIIRGPSIYSAYNGSGIIRIGHDNARQAKHCFVELMYNTNDSGRKIFVDLNNPDMLANLEKKVTTYIKWLIRQGLTRGKISK